ncbi:MAG: sulfate ABC transporter permease subunit CysT [Chloroflexota bacterium]
MAELSVSTESLKPSVKSGSAVRFQIPYGTWGLRFAALCYLTACVIIPLIVIHVEGFRYGLDVFIQSVTRPAALRAVGLTLWTSALMTVINVIMGTLTAYVLVSYKFPGKAILNTLIDLPFAIPTLVTGVMLVLLYGPQTAIGGFFETQLGIRILFAPPGIVLALLFISYPFVVRTVQPVLMQLDVDQQEVAYTLGASPLRTFRRVILPAIRPAIITGGLLTFARALGEFGSVVIVAGNIPMRTQVASVYIYAQVEAGDMQAASGVSVILLLIAFGITLGVDFLQRRNPTHA